MTPRDILGAVSQASGIDIADLLGPSHCWRYAWPRQLVYLLVREHCEKSLPWIAAFMNREDHTTALHGCRAARDRMQAVPEYRALHDRVLAALTIPEEHHHE